MQYKPPRVMTESLEGNMASNMATENTVNTNSNALGRDHEQQGLLSVLLGELPGFVSLVPVTGRYFQIIISLETITT